MSQQSTEPLSLERARLLLGWLRAQHAVDSCLSELLAAGPGGERRVSADIDRVSALVAGAGAAFETYRTCVESAHGRDPAGRPALRSVDAETVTPRGR